MTPFETNHPVNPQLVKNLLQRIDPTSGVDVGHQLGLSDRYFDAMFAVAVKYYDNNRFDDAMKIARQLILMESNNHRNYKLYAACFQAKEDYVSAIRVYQNSIALGALDAEVYFYAGQCFFLSKKFKEASESLRFAKTLCEKSPEKWTHIAHHVNDLLARAKQRSEQA